MEADGCYFWTNKIRQEYKLIAKSLRSLVTHGAGFCSVKQMRVFDSP